MAVKKRYHQSMKDRMHERKGEERMMERRRESEMREPSHAQHHGLSPRVKNYRGNEEYAGLDDRREWERRDFEMISEDHSAPANLPQAPMLKYWPKARHYADYGLDDTISGIDHQMDKDNSEMEKHLQPEKY